MKPDANGPDFAEIGKRLKQLRIEKGLSQSIIAKAASVKPSHISNIENLRSNVSLTTLFRICMAMNVTLDYVLLGERNYKRKALKSVIIKNLEDLSDDTLLMVFKIVKSLR